MNAVYNKLPALVEEELAAANQTFPAFHSLHEGWAVLREEVDEAQAEMGKINRSLRAIWHDVRGDSVACTLTEARNIQKAALQTAAEAIQIAAMARKLKDYACAHRGGDAK